MLEAYAKTVCRIHRNTRRSFVKASRKTTVNWSRRCLLNKLSLVSQSVPTLINQMSIPIREFIALIDLGTSGIVDFDELVHDVIQLGQPHVILNVLTDSERIIRSK